MNRAVLAAAGGTAFALLWETFGRLEFLGAGWPALSDIIREFSLVRTRSLLLRALAASGGEAVLGYILGVVLAVAFATLGALWGHLRSGILNLAAVVQAIPAIALGPLLMAVFPRDVTPIVLATLAVYFTMFVSASTAFANTSAAQNDLFTTLGSSRLDRFGRLQLPNSVPLLIAGLKFAAPSALLGAIIGEWFGAESGIGPILVAAMQNFRINLLWSAAILAACASMFVYALLSWLEHAASQRYA